LLSVRGEKKETIKQNKKENRNGGGRKEEEEEDDEERGGLGYRASFICLPTTKGVFDEQRETGRPH